MCCGSRMCMLCTCVILVVIAIGFLFGFGVFKNVFHRIKDTVHVGNDGAGRPFLGSPFAPTPF